MNTKNLKNDMIVKNYTEMCLLLEEEKKTGYSKIAQHKEWERHFSFGKDGHKYIIKEIFETPVPRGFRPDDIYTKDVNTILKYMLSDNNRYSNSYIGDARQYFTMKNLLVLCGFTNERWSKIDNIEEYAEDNQISYKKAKYLYNRLYQNVYRNCVRNLNRCLERLEKRGYIKTREVLRVNITPDNKFNKRDAELREETIYETVSNSLKTEMNIKMLNIYNWNDYYEKLNARLSEHGIYGALKETSIVYNANLNRESEISQDEYKNALKNINANTLTAMKVWIEREVRKDVEKIQDSSDIGIELLELFFSDNIRQMYRDLVEYFIVREGNEHILTETADFSDTDTDWINDIA